MIRRPADAGIAWVLFAVGFGLWIPIGWHIVTCKQRGGSWGWWGEGCRDALSAVPMGPAIGGDPFPADAAPQYLDGLVGDGGTLVFWDGASLEWQAAGDVTGTSFAQTTNHFLMLVEGELSDGGRGDVSIWYLDAGTERFVAIGGLPCAEACTSFGTSPRDDVAVKFRYPYTDRLLRLVSDCLREQCGVAPVKGSTP